MIKRDLQNEKLKAVGRRLLRAGKVSDSEIEKIAAAPQLFERVRANIKREESRRETKIKNVFAFPALQFWSWQKSALAFAVIGILIVCVTAMFTNFSAPPETAQQNIDEVKQADISSIEKQPKASAKQNIELPKRKFQLSQTGFLKKTKNNLSNLPKPARAKKRFPQKFENQTEEPFIALTYAGDLANGDSQIVRVEMTRARLLSLGVAVQTENESEKIKTDLLVGSDGLARAFRLVK